MSVNNGRITAPVDTSDPYIALGVGIRSTGWDIGYICCNEHGKTNKWAMYKPVKHSSPGELTDEQRRSVLYGLVRTPVHTNGYTEASDWSYAPPSATDWTRILDFEGYHHGAVPGIRFCGWPTFITVDRETAIPRPTGAASDGCIPAEHLMSMRNAAGNAWTPMYWGVGYKLYGSGGGDKLNWKVKTVDEPVSSATGQPVASFPLKVVDLAEWSQHSMANPTLELCVFLSETRIASWTNNADIVPFPKYTAEYRFHEYSGTGLRYYYAPLYRAMNAEGRGQAAYTRADLLSAKPITIYIAFGQNPYSSQGAYAPGAGTRFKMRYHKYSYASGDEVQSAEIYEKQFTTEDMALTADHEARLSVGRMTIPRSDMFDESLKNLIGVATWPFEVWEYAQTDNDGTMEWREITDYTARPYVQYDGRIQ